MQKMQLVFDYDLEQGAEGVGLPDLCKEMYNGDLVMPPLSEGRATVSCNFVHREDGVVNIPEAAGGKIISAGSPEDLALMAILRAAFDAVMVGSETLSAENEHLWTARYIAQFSDPKFGDVLEEWREKKYGSKNPYNIIVSRSGMVKSDDGQKIPLNLDYPVFHQPDIVVILVTTESGKAALAEQLDKNPQIKVLTVSEDNMEQEILLRLHQEFGINQVLCEGGPTLFGAFNYQGLITDYFLTETAGMAGRARGSSRATLMQGYEFPAEKGLPQPEFVSLRIPASDRKHLVKRSRNTSR